MTPEGFILAILIITSLVASVFGGSYSRCDASSENCPDDILPTVLLLEENKAYCKYTECNRRSCPSDEDCIETKNGFKCVARASSSTDDPSAVAHIVPTSTTTTTTTSSPTTENVSAAPATRNNHNSGNSIDNLPSCRWYSARSTPSPPSPVLLVADTLNNKIHILGDSSFQWTKDLDVGSADPRGIAYNPQGRMIFYGSQHGQRVFWRTLNGSQTGVVPNFTCSDPVSIAIDEEGRRLFASCQDSYIQSVNLNGSQPYQISLRSVYNVIMAKDTIISLNDKKRKLLLASTGNGFIYRMELDGSDKQEVLHDKQIVLTVTWDQQCQRIFFASGDTESTIQVVDITGKNRRILITKADLQPEGLAYYDGYIYWTNRVSNARDYGTGIGNISAEANDTQDFEFYYQSWAGYEIIARGDLAIDDLE